MPAGQEGSGRAMNKSMLSGWKGIPALALLGFLLLAIGVYMAIERYVPARGFEGRSEDLYWSVAQMQLELEKARADLLRLKAGEVPESQVQFRLAVANSRFLDFVTPSKMQEMLSRVDGFKGTASLLQDFFEDENILHPSLRTAQQNIDRIDSIRPSLAEFAVQARVAEVSSRDARNKDLRHNQQLVASLWFALGGICMVIFVLLYRYQGARRDAAARQQLLEQEREAHKATVNAELDRTTFLATLSHEIRSPLQTMQVCVELIEPDIDPAGKAAKAVGRLKTCMAHLMTQVRDIMDISAIKNMQFRLHISDVDVAAALNEVIDVHRAQLDGKGLGLHVRLGELPPKVRLDGDRLRQIVGNLLTNAIRYTDHGTVTVEAGVDAADGRNILDIRVIDTGIGVPEEFQSRIFQPFFQGHARRVGSSGLGLAVVKELVSLLGGELELKSVVGVGSEFIVRLPIVVPDQLPGPERSVLVVDDDKNIREPFSDCLQMNGYAVSTASSVAEACQKLQQASFNVVLLDMQLGNESGYSVAEALKRSVRHRGVKIIAMTAYPEEYADPRAAWFAARLEKPFDISRLRAVLGRALESPPGPGHAG